MIQKIRHALTGLLEEVLPSLLSLQSHRAFRELTLRLFPLLDPELGLFLHTMKKGPFHHRLAEKLRRSHSVEFPASTIAITLANRYIVQFIAVEPRSTYPQRADLFRYRLGNPHGATASLSKARPPTPPLAPTVFWTIAFSRYPFCWRPLCPLQRQLDGKNRSPFAFSANHQNHPWASWVPSGTDQLLFRC